MWWWLATTAATTGWSWATSSGSAKPDDPSSDGDPSEPAPETPSEGGLLDRLGGRLDQWNPFRIGERTTERGLNALTTVSVVGLVGLALVYVVQGRSIVGGVVATVQTVVQLPIIIARATAGLLGAITRSVIQLLRAVGLAK